MPLTAAYSTPADNANGEYIISDYVYNSNEVTVGPDGTARVTPNSKTYTFRTEKAVPRVGVMLVGWGGNNGCTVTAGILANKKNLTWRTKEGTHASNYWGSLTQASTVR